jgi:acyl-CoA thioesterase-1
MERSNGVVTCSRADRGVDSPAMLPRQLPRALVALVLAATAACSEGPAEEARSARAPLRTPESLSRPADDAGTSVPAPDVPADAPLVVFLGDSIAAGLHLEPDAAFPAVAQRLLAAEGRPFRLVNAGVSGDTTAGGLRRVDWLLGQDPDVLVVELGGNDGLRGQPAAEIEARLREIVTRAQAAGARVLLLGVRLPPSLGQDYVREFEALYPRLAEELGCAYVPFFMDGVGGVDGMMLDDGIHPNRAGHARIGENVARVLGELVADD